jgi:hypothetical protein
MGTNENEVLRHLAEVDAPEVVQPALRRFRMRTFLLVIAAIIGGFLLILLGIHFVASNLRDLPESGRFDGRVAAVSQDASSLCINTRSGQECGIPQLRRGAELPKIGDEVAAYYYLVPTADDLDAPRELSWVAFFKQR